MEIKKYKNIYSIIYLLMEASRVDCGMKRGSIELLGFLTVMKLVQCLATLSLFDTDLKLNLLQLLFGDTAERK